MKLACTSCGRTIRPTPDQADAARASLATAMLELPVGCPECRRFTLHRVQRETEDARPSRAPGLSFRCPVAGCAGFLAFVEKRGLESAHHRCARCQSVWFSEDALQGEIAKIAELYPYRAAVYRREDSGFFATSVSETPADYEARIREEPDGRSRNHVRG